MTSKWDLKFYSGITWFHCDSMAFLILNWTGVNSHLAGLQGRTSSDCSDRFFYQLDSKPILQPNQRTYYGRHSSTAIIKCSFQEIIRSVITEQTNQWADQQRFRIWQIRNPAIFRNPAKSGSSQISSWILPVQLQYVQLITDKK